MSLEKEKTMSTEDRHAAAAAYALSRHFSQSSVRGPNHPGERISSDGDGNHIKQLMIQSNNYGEIPQQMTLTFSFNASNGIVSRLDDGLLDYMLQDAPQCKLPQSTCKTGLIQAAKDIRLQYWDLFRFRLQRCCDNEQLAHQALSMPNYVRQSSLEGAILKKDCRGGWICVLEVISPCETALGCLIATQPCNADCVKMNMENRFDISDNHSMYFSEVTAASLLLTKRLFQNTSVLDMWYKKRPVSALVVNMTPTEVRVIEAIVHNPSKPKIEFILRETIGHNIDLEEHWICRLHQDEFLACPGCRRVFSWLHFTRPGVDLKRPPPSTPSRDIKPRVASGKSDSSQDSGISMTISTAVSTQTDVTRSSQSEAVVVSENVVGEMDKGTA